MGQANGRKLQAVNAADKGEPIPISAATAYRLGDLFNVSQGAKLVAQAAITAANQAETDWQNAAKHVVEALGLDPDMQWHIDFRAFQITRVGELPISAEPIAVEAGP